MAVKIRKSKSSDAKGVANVLYQSYNIQSIKEGVAVFRNETAKSHYYVVAEDNGRVVGIATWLMHGLPKHQLCELDRIAVLPEYRGKGAARLLFEALVKDAKEFYKNFMYIKVRL